MVPSGGALHPAVAETELADRGVERKTVDAPAGTIDEHGARAIDHIPGGHDPHAGLKEVLERTRGAERGDAAADRKDRADGGIDVDVGAPVQRVHEHDVLGPVGHLVVKNDDVVVFFTGYAGAVDAVPEHADQLVVGEKVQLLDVLALDVDRARVAQNVVHQPRLVDFHVDPLCGQADIPEQSGEFAGGGGKLSQLLDRELVQGQYSTMGLHATSDRLFV